MSFNYDGEGVQPTGRRKAVPRGQYILKITDTDERKSKNGDP